jgi:hypothetical protein
LEVETAIGLLAGMRGLEVAEAEQRLDEAALRAGVDRAAVAHVLVRVLRQDP